MNTIDYYQHRGNEVKGLFNKQKKFKKCSKELVVQFGDWSVNLDGDLYHYEKGFFIAHKDLLKKNWVKNMHWKNWVDMNTFCDAYFFGVGINFQNRRKN